ncbi:MAG: YebC/PmpR family DNA-binding transcriptional regulator [Proteobacteria bacterium]|nr:YebC/PmpR family DNA-binding transcriptional regulator [Pseudomonadota bacterium]
MAGHSKWKNIQHRKGSQDKKRSRLFTKLGVDLQVASRTGGEDPASNPRLRMAISKARDANMPRDIIERHIQRGQSRLNSEEEYKEKLYEGYGPGGTAIIVECLTDNVNRTASEMRFLFSRGHGQMAGSGSVTWMFERCGLLVFKNISPVEQKQLWEHAITLDAHDVTDHLNGQELTLEAMVPTQNFAEIKEALEQIKPSEFAEIIWHPKSTVEVGPEDHESLTKLLESLDDNQDVQAVYDNSFFIQKNLKSDII